MLLVIIKILLLYLRMAVYINTYRFLFVFINNKLFVFNKYK